jgi:hypothetical protein
MSRIKSSRFGPRAALALVLTSLFVAGCKLDTSTPSGWQSRGPRSSATLPEPDKTSPTTEQTGVAEGSGKHKTQLSP